MEVVSPRDHWLSHHLLMACMPTPAHFSIPPPPAAGEGVPLRVELSDPSQRTLSFGAVPRGQAASRQLSVANRGRAPAVFSLAPARELFERLGIEALPAAPVVLRPREETAITLFYRRVGSGQACALQSKTLPRVLAA